MGRIAPAVGLTVLAIALGGCGAGTSLLTGRTSTTASATERAGSPGTAVSAADLRVVKGWAGALRRGDIAAAARYFHIPSVFYDGSGAALRIRSFAQAELANTTLSCGAEFVSAHRQGPFVDVLFRLTDRAGQGGVGNACGSGVGMTARTDFIIHRGLIVDWVRAPDEPGDNGSQGGGGQTTPSTPTVPGGASTV